MQLANGLVAALAMIASVYSAGAAEIEASVGRNGANKPDDVLIVQILLNQVPADQGGPETMLEPDGVNGSKTVAAIERFQHHQLGEGSTDGRVDPGAATIKRLNAVVDAQPLRERIVSVAKGERLFWRDGRRTELDAVVSTRLQKYWKAVGLDYTVEQLQTADFQADNPWSAAFVSWVMKTAGAEDQFHYSASHWEYVAAAKANRNAGNHNPFQAYPADDQPAELADIVVKRRASSMATYENIETGHMTHGDIVVSVMDGKAETIGGNVSNSVKTTTVELNDDLKVKATGYCAIVKVN